jgi:hypothetical protein
MTVIDPRSCEGCGTEFTPARTDGKYCPECVAAGKNRKKTGKELVPAESAVAAAVAEAEVAEVTIVDEDEEDDNRPIGRVRSRKQWANRIRVKLRRTAQAIVSIGIDLAEAKADIPPGQWLDFLEADLGMAERTAQRFMQVAHHEVLADPQYHDRLPASMRTLANLAAMKPADLRKAIETGDVTTDTEQTWATRVARAYQLGEPESLHEPRLPRVKPVPVSEHDLAHMLYVRDPAAVARAHPQDGDPYFALDIEDLFRWSARVLRHLGRELPELAEPEDTGEG